MKNWAMLLACGMVAFAIGCGDGGGDKAAKTNGSPDAAKAAQEAMRGKMETGGAVAPGAGAEAAPADGGEKKEEAGEKKEEAGEKKEEAGEKKEEAGEKKE